MSEIGHIYIQPKISRNNKYSFRRKLCNPAQANTNYACVWNENEAATLNFLKLELYTPKITQSHFSMMMKIKKPHINLICIS